MSFKGFLAALGGPEAQQAGQYRRERTAMDALGRYLKPGGDQAALAQAYEADPVLAMKAQGMQQEQQKAQMGLESEQRRRVGAIAKFIHSAPEDRKAAAYESALPTLRQTFPNQPLPDRYGPEVEQAVYSIMGLAAGDTGVGAGNGVQSTYLDADGNRVAVMRDGSMQILGAADVGMANQSVEVTGADGRTRRMTFNKRTGQYEEAGGSMPAQAPNGQPPAQQQSVTDPALLASANAIIQALTSRGIPSAEAGQIADKFLQDSAIARGGKIYPGDSAPQVSNSVNNQFVSRTPEDNAFRIEQAKNAAAREQMPYEIDQARAKAQAEAEAKANVERQTDEPKRQEKIRQQITAIDNVVSTIDRAAGKINWATSGAIGKVSSWAPGSPAYGLSKALETVKANIGFDRLQQMRDASPTGGALGQVAVQELDSLQASIASLDQYQDPEDLEYGLIQVKRHYEGWKDAVKRADAQAQRRAGGQGLAPQGGPSAVDSILDKYR